MQAVLLFWALPGAPCQHSWFLKAAVKSGVPASMAGSSKSEHQREWLDRRRCLSSPPCTGFSLKSKSEGKDKGRGLV